MTGVVWYGVKNDIESLDRRFRARAISWGQKMKFNRITNFLTLFVTIIEYRS